MRILSAVPLRPLAAALLVLPCVAPVVAQEEDEPFGVMAMLDGEGVTGGGAEDGYAQFAGEIDKTTGELCYTLVVEDLEMTAAHIHKGKVGENGATVVTLEATGEDDDDVCLKLDRAVAKAITAKPSNYYVNVHSAEFPAGAIRGQLED